MLLIFVTVSLPTCTYGFLPCWFTLLVPCFPCPCTFPPPHLGASGTTATRSLGLAVIHVKCPAKACYRDHIVKAKEIAHAFKPGARVTQKYKIYCTEGGQLQYKDRRQCTRSFSSLTIAGPDGHDATSEMLAACHICSIFSGS